MPHSWEIPQRTAVTVSVRTLLTLLESTHTQKEHTHALNYYPCYAYNIYKIIVLYCDDWLWIEFAKTNN